MSVEIDPTELGFQRPFSQEVSQTLTIKNSNHSPVAFKVKTTAPKQYCVRPNSGRIEPGKEVDVTVLLQAMKQEPPLDAKCRDKFLVQSVAITADKEFTNTSTIWQHVDEAEKGTVMEKKIRVVFLPAAGSDSSAQAVTPLRKVNGVEKEPAPPAYRSPSPEAPTFTPQAKNIAAPSAPAPKVESEPVSSKPVVEAKVSAPSPVDSSLRNSVASAVTAVSSNVPSSDDVKSTGQDAGLRQRKATGTSAEAFSPGANEMAQRLQQQAPQGVPVQVVAVLCFLSFLLAWIFF